MARYLFYPTADAAQDRIWKDTVEIWGEAQAIAYIHGLHAHLARLAVSRALWRRFPETMPISSLLKQKAYFSRYEKHLCILPRAIRRQYRCDEYPASSDGYTEAPDR